MIEQLGWDKLTAIVAVVLGYLMFFVMYLKDKKDERKDRAQEREDCREERNVLLGLLEASFKAKGDPEREALFSRAADNAREAARIARGRR